MLKKLSQKNNKTTLLVIQSTPFCNISCSYCYLGNKDRFIKMDTTVFEDCLNNLIESRIDYNNLSIVFHAGEPLTVGIEYYRILWGIAKKKLTKNFKFCFQTNATLLDDEWVHFFKEIKAHVGVSIDGFAEIHDQNRKLKNGRGSFDMVMNGINILQKNEYPFYTISVLTKHSFEYGDQLIEFLASLKPKSICFNIDEIEGPNKVTTVSYYKVKDFFTNLLSYSEKYPHIKFREISTLNGRLSRLNSAGKKIGLGIQNAM